jgi:MFS transporter, MHS family, proline/betaine transporter
MTIQLASLPVARPTGAQMRRAVVAASFGNIVEWFDFVAYGLLATVIAAHFFTAANNSGGAGPLLLTFATFGVGFLARPVGGLLIGMFGDRRGRKPALVLSISLMGISTGIIALIPDYNAIGIAAPIVLVLARMAQGFAAGGEWGGAASFLVEWAPNNRRGLFGSFHITTIFIGTVAGSALIAAMTSAFGAGFMADWGWRIPFVFGALIALIALPFRARAEETPVFVEEKVQDDEAEAVEVAPLKKSELGLKLAHTFFLVGMQSAAVYTFTAYFPAFLQKYVTVAGHLVGPGQALWSNTIASVVVIVVVISSGAVSDKIGRKPGMLVSSLLVLVLTYPLTQLLLQAHTFLAVVLIQSALAALVAIFLGCMPAVLVELFPTRIRVAGLSSSYNLASAIFGGFAPLIATALIEVTGMPVAASFWVLFAALLSTVAVIMLKETRGVEIR